MWLIAGLGNPGNEYALNRHNIGFMAVDFIADYFNFEPWKKKFNGLISQGIINNQKTLLVKPQTYMNNSGHCLGLVSNFYKIETEHIIAIYDELDLPPNTMRVKQGGGSGGHNGIKSIDGAVGKNYYRVRMGIGHPGHKDRVSGYVLSNFSKNEMASLPDFISAVGQNITEMIQENEPNIATYMNKVTLDMNGKK